MRFVVLAILAGCISDPTVSCGDVQCAANQVCTPAGACATPDNAAACAGKADHDRCTTSSIGNGACGAGACHAITCGDGVVDPGEACDDGNLVTGDGCSATCDSNETCGNGVIDVNRGEQCDDGNLRSNDGCASTCVLELPSWLEVTPAPIAARTNAAMAYDQARGTMVVFGGHTISDVLADTWLLYNTDTAWIPAFPFTSPPPRSTSTMVYDSRRARIVLFGGNGASGPLADTWAWDGTTWTDLAPPASPSPRGYAAAAYDPLRDRVVVYGGAGNGASLADTWEFDGTTWLETTPASSPPAATDAAMTFDPTRGTVVMIGGGDDRVPQDTWDYDGVWTKRTVPTTPNVWFAASMTFDESRQRVVLFGGETLSGPDTSNVWEWTGTDWTQVIATPFPGSAPGPGDTISFAYDPHLMAAVAFGGSNQTTVFGATFTWDGALWTPLAQPNANPPARGLPAAAFDARSGQVVMFGGFDNLVDLGDTWRWDGHTWAQGVRGPTPEARDSGALAPDASGHLILFGGLDDNGPTIAYPSEPWRWDGAVLEWTQLHPATSPPGREGCVMAYDSTSHVTLMFGGATYDDAMGIWIEQADTWTWDGSTWAQLSPATSPSAREIPSMAYDPIRDRIVMFGGFDAATDAVLADTWEWDGTTWADRSPALSPPARDGEGLVYDPERKRVVLFGGGSVAGIQDTWEWDGTTWTALVPVHLQPTRFGSDGIYDPIRRAMIMFGGQDSVGGMHADTWQLQWASTLPAERCVLATADEDGDGLAGCADPDCWARCSPACPPGVTCPAGAPRCGDGTCQPIEDALICPADCPAP